MIPPRPPEDEAARLATLREYEVLDTPPEQAFDDIVHLAAQILDVPISLVSLVDEDRQWFKARFGLDAPQTPRDISFCGHAVLGSEVMVVADATADSRFWDNPLVLGDPSIHFYAGAPLVTPSGSRIGTLCAIDRRPRTVTPAQLDALDRLARQVVAQLELRRRIALLDQEQRQRREADEIRHRFFELSLDMLCIASSDGYYRAINPAWEAVTGFSREELRSRPFVEFFHPDDRESTMRQAQAVGAGGQVIGFENRHVTKSGEYRTFLWSATGDPEMGVMMAVARDVTASRAERAALEAATRTAESASRAKTEFLATMSHELRTPLNSVIGFTSVLRHNRSGNLNARQLDHLRRIGDNGRHLLQLIDDILDLTRVEAGNLISNIEPCNIAVLLAEVVGQLEGQAAAHCTSLVLTPPPRSLPVETDPRHVRQVLINLIGNAIKFARDGHVEVRLRCDPEGRPLRVEVADDGIGIAGDKLGIIFESFRQADEGTSRQFGGSGLGLAIARAMSRELGHELEVVSEPDKGTVFGLRFAADADPLKLEPPRRATAEIAPRRPPPRDRPSDVPGNALDGWHALVVDDEDDARVLVADMLRERGCVVAVARDGAEGLAAARQTRPDLIVLDLLMPNGDGWSVLSALSATPALAAIPVIVCSVIGQVSRATIAGALAVFDKPVDEADFLRAVETALAGRPSAKVLVVDTDANRRDRTAELIDAAGAVPVRANDFDAAIARLQSFVPGCVLVPGDEIGFAVLAHIRADPRLANVAVVVHSTSPSSSPSTTIQRGRLAASNIRELLAGLGLGPDTATEP